MKRKSFILIPILLCLVTLFGAVNTAFATNNQIMIDGFLTKTYFSVTNTDITIIESLNEMEGKDGSGNITYTKVDYVEKYVNYKTTFIVRSNSAIDYVGVTTNENVNYQNDLIKISNTNEVDKYNAIFGINSAKIGDYVFSIKYKACSVSGKLDNDVVGSLLIICLSIAVFTIVISYFVLFYFWKKNKVKGKFFDVIYIWLNNLIGKIKKIKLK